MSARWALSSEKRPGSVSQEGQSREGEFDVFTAHRGGAAAGGAPVPRKVKARPWVPRMVALRHQLGLTQAQLAATLQGLGYPITRYMIENYERALADPGPRELLALAHTFGVSTDYLLKGGGGPGEARARGGAQLDRVVRRLGLVPTARRLLQALAQASASEQELVITTVLANLETFRRQARRVALLERGDSPPGSRRRPPSAGPRRTA